jgi:hypothetical protein
LSNSPTSSGPPLYRLKSVAVHLALLRTDKVVLFSGDHRYIWNWNRGESSIWDPQNPNQSNNPTLNRNLFCSGHCFLPDGRLFVAGGQSITNHPAFVVLSVLSILPAILKLLGREAADHDIHTFDPAKEEWHYYYRIKMPKARWYPTCVTLPDGKAMIVSGAYSHTYYSLFGGFINTDYEIFDPSTNTLSKPAKFIEKIELYPFLHVLPGGILFVHSKDTSQFWNIAESKVIPNIEFHTKSKGTRTYPGMGSSVLLPLDQKQQEKKTMTTTTTPPLDTARILLVGGSTSMSPNNNTDATDIAEIFTVDLRNPANSPGWDIVPANPIKRFLCDSVLLPDGTVLVTNGAKKGVADDNKEAVKEIELFNPSNNSWTIIGTLQKPRLYHSSAVLLPDGRVLVAGSTGHNWIRAALAPADHFEHNVEIINPPYLQGNVTTRPTIETFPPHIPYRSSFEVTTTDDVHDIKTVSLIRLSSTTHNNNMDQRCIMLSIMDRTIKTVKLSTPNDSSWAPPGYYMLFLVNNDGVPSIGKIIQVGC